MPADAPVMPDLEFSKSANRDIILPMLTHDFSRLPARDRHRWMVSSIIPRPIAFVSTISPNGVTNLAPFSYFNGVSSDPPVVTIAVTWRRSGEKDTLRNIEATGELVINIVTENIAAQMNTTSGDYPYEVSEFELAGLTPLPSQLVKPPRVAESPVHFECRLLQVVRVGEPATAIVLAEIVLVHADESVLTNGAPDPHKLQPVARLGGNLYSTLGDLFEMERPKVS